MKGTRGTRGRVIRWRAHWSHPDAGIGGLNTNSRNRSRVRTGNAKQCFMLDIVIGRNTDDPCGSVGRYAKAPAIITGRNDCPNVSLINGQASVLEMPAKCELRHRKVERIAHAGAGIFAIAGNDITG
jgi:hypothetical protein